MIFYTSILNPYEYYDTLQVGDPHPLDCKCALHSRNFEQPIPETER